MKIKIKRSKKEYTIGKIDFCCNQMKEAWTEKYIIFGEMDSLLNYNTNVNICHCSPYPEGASWDEMSINYCPFCGKEIDIEENINGL